MIEYRTIDADQHIVEPPDLWERWLPERFRERAPKLVKDEDQPAIGVLGLKRSHHLLEGGLVLVSIVGGRKLVGDTEPCQSILQD